jgi:SAM-dependent methyltransferase
MILWGDRKQCTEREPDREDKWDDEARPRELEHVRQAKRCGRRHSRAVSQGLRGGLRSTNWRLSGTVTVSESVNTPAYDRMGLDYSAVRRADPRFEEAIWTALGEAKSVLNVGAGAGSYEPNDREVIALEPSPVMIAQRPPDAAPAIQGVVESIPLADKSVDATMGVFTMQHWQDIDQGLAEVLRVSRDRVVLLTLDLDTTSEMWLIRDYLPEIVEHDRKTFPSIEHLEAVLPGVRVDTIPVPADCTDGFCVALWSRPEAHLDPDVRKASSIWHLLPPAVIERGLEQLRRDLNDGEWKRRYGDLYERDSLDIGLRLVQAQSR